MKLQTIKKQVEVVFEDRTRLEGSIFLSPISAHRWGKESIEELLNGDRKYVPLEVNPEEVVLLSKNAIVMALTKETEPEAIPRGPTRIWVEVVFRSGETLRGEVYHDLPITHARLSDYLNRSGAFFHIEVGSKDYFVSTAFVRLIKPADPDEAAAPS